MNLFVWIEATGLAEWIRVSSVGYPMMITLHSLGLAIMVGMSVVLSLRVIGAFASIPYSALPQLLKVAWLGFLINTISGSSLFAAQATDYLTNVPFLIKIFLVFLGAVLVAWLQVLIKAGGEAWTTAGTAPQLAKTLSWITIIVWAGAMTLGRLTAYL